MLFDLRQCCFQQSRVDDYRILRLHETPRIKGHIIVLPGGMGALATAVAPPTLTNALFVATGVRLRRLPIDRVYQYN